MRVIAGLVGFVAGWIAGVYAYVLIIRLGGGEMEGGIHIGILPLGLAGALGGAVLFASLWSRRRGDRGDGV